MNMTLARGSDIWRHGVSKRHLRTLLYFGVLAWLLGANPLSLKGQDGTDGNPMESIGVPLFSTQLPVENGYINAFNADLHLDVPLGSFPQRAESPISYHIAYDSAIWTVGANNTWTPNNSPGWVIYSSADWGTPDYNTIPGTICNTDGVEEWDTFSHFTWIAADGTSHLFPIYTRWGNPYSACGNFSYKYIGSGDALAIDGSGYHMYVTLCNLVIVYAPDGNMVYTDLGGNPPSVNDTNGNQTSYSNGLKDTLGQVRLTNTKNGNTQTLGVTNSEGGTSTYIVNWTSFGVHTAFGGPYGNFSCTSCIGVIQSIQLPDNTSYLFKYDCDSSLGNPACGSPHSQMFYTGELTSMTLPTGSQITYSYTYFNGADGAGYYATNGLSGRTTPDGSWSYTLAQATPCTSPNTECEQLTVTSPSSDNTVYKFNINGGVWPYEADYYNGAVSSAHLLASITQTFDYSNPCIYNGTPYHLCTAATAMYVTKLSTTTTLPIPSGNISGTTKYTWSTAHNGNLVQKSEWNLGSNTSNNADRTTCFGYLSDSTHYLHIVNRATSITVVNNASSTPCSSIPPTANIVAQTLNSYDGSTLVTSGATGAAQHDDTDFGSGFIYRGNLTKVQKLISGTSNYLTKSMTYDITGQLRTETDWMNNTGNPTQYSYTDSFFKDVGESSNLSSYTPSQLTNAYLTTITYPTVNSVSLSEKSGYYWYSGEKAISTDPNNQTTYFHFFDSGNLDRPTATFLPNQGWALTRYNSTETEVDQYTGITSLTPSTNCTGTSGGCRRDESLFDGLGRVSSQILVSDPDGATTGGTTYDSDARVSTVSNPHRSASLPTDGTETYGYDGLNRKIQVTRADAELAHTYYGAAVSSFGGLSSQKCSSSFGSGYPILSKDEAGNLRQTWTDGFGRLIEVDEPNSSGSLSSGVATCYAYDLNNNLVGLLQPGSEVTCTLNSVTYNRCFTYDLLSRLTASTNPESGTINYYYMTSGGSLCSGDPSAVCQRTDARNITTTYSYDALNRLILKSYNDSNPTTPTVQYGYDAVAPSGCTLPTLTITNGLSRRTGMCDGSGQTAWSYDSVGNATTEVRKITSVSPNVTESISMTYNYDSSVAQITYPTNRIVTYATGNAQRQKTATDTTTSTHINYALGPSTCPNGQNWVCYAPQGALNLLQNGSSLVTTSYYNNRLQPCRTSVNSGTVAPTSCGDMGHSGDKFDLQYSFDMSSVNTPCSTSFSSPTNNGNVAALTNDVTSMSGRSQNFCYDALDRIKLAETTSTFSTGPRYCWGETYTIDPLGNLTTIGQITGTYNGCIQESGFSLTINGKNQISTSGFGYDSAGNMTASPNLGGQSMAYDAEGRIRVTAGTTYTYDGDGNRVEKSGSALYWYSPNGQVLTETDTSGNNPTDYVFFAGKRIARVSSGNVYYYFSDQLGSSRVLVQDGTTPTLCYDADFYPYGGELAYTTSCTQHYKFTGKERDSESGLDNFGARYNSSQYGRFMSPDSTAYSGLKNPQSWNLYAYTLNNPLRYVDPTGHTVECKTKAADCLSAAQAAVGKNAAGQLSTKTTQSFWQKIFGGSTTTLQINGSEADFRGASGNASKLADLIDSKTNFGVSIQHTGDPQYSSVINSILGGGATDLQGGAITYTPSQGYLPAVFLDPSSAATTDTDASRDHIPPANMAEKFAHELLGHEWGEVFGGHPAGSAANKQDAINSENEVRRTDPSQGQKTEHHD
jgi:RHS repeat-associated protein